MAPVQVDPAGSFGASLSPRAKALMAATTDMRDYVRPTQDTDLWQGLVAEAQPAIIAGESASGKTTIVTGLVHAVSRGQKYLGTPVQMGATLYLAVEDAAGVKKRLETFERKTDQPLYSPVYIVDHGIDFSRTEDFHAVREIIGTCQEQSGHKIRLVVIDTLSKCLGSLSENDSSDMNFLFGGLEEICRRTGVTVLGIHHTPKSDAGQLRGSGAIQGAAHSVLMVKGREGPRTLFLEKKKDDQDKRIAAKVDLISVDCGTLAPPSGAGPDWEIRRDTTAIAVMAVEDESKYLKLSDEQHFFMSRLFEVIEDSAEMTTAKMTGTAIPCVSEAVAKEHYIERYIQVHDRNRKAAQTSWSARFKSLERKSVIAAKQGMIWITKLHLKRAKQ